MAFIPTLAPTLTGHGQPDVDELKRAQVVAVDMETALLYVMGTRFKIAVAAMCLVTNNFSPFEIIEARGAG